MEFFLEVKNHQPSQALVDSHKLVSDVFFLSDDSLHIFFQLLLHSGLNAREFG